MKKIGGFFLVGMMALTCADVIGRIFGYPILGAVELVVAMTTVSACTGFGAVCGSSPATAATMATVGLPEMKRFNYANELSTGAVASGGGLGMIMPPSVVLIVYGVLTEQSIGKLFVAGILPAFLVTILFIIAIFIWCTRNPDQGPRGERYSWKAKIKSLTKLGETMAVFVLVMGGLFSGLFTPTEAAAVGAFGVLLVSILRRQLTWTSFVDSLYETLKTSCMVMMLIAGATIFGKFFAVTRIPFEIATEIGAWCFECTAQSGGLHVNEAFFLVEIEDIETGQIIEEPGKRGKMIISALDRQAQPCIRFDSKDVIEWAEAPCPCGRTFRLIKGGVQGRADDITKVKGVLLSPGAIEEVVRGIEGLGDEFEVIVDKVGDIDRITLKVELVLEYSDMRPEIEPRLKDQLRLKTNLGYVLEFHKHGTLPRYEVKAKRFKDFRKNH